MIGNVKQAVIMVGGQGMRLRPLTNNCPKPILPILDKPCTEYFIDSLAEAGIEEIILACGFRSQQVKDTLGDGSRQGIKITYSYEDHPLGTAGALKLVEDKLDDAFIMVYGDNFLEMDYGRMVNKHRKTKADISIALSVTDNPCDFGIVRMEGDDIVEFKEKPKPEEVFSNLFNAGVYVMNRDILGYVPEDTMFDISKDLIPAMMKDNRRIVGYNGVPSWMDIGRPKYYRNANITAARNWYSGHDWSSRSESSSIEESFIGEGAFVRASRLRNSVVSEGSAVNRTAMRGSVILPGCKVDDSRLRDSVVGRNCTIRNSDLENCVIADNSVVVDRKLFNQTVE